MYQSQITMNWPILQVRQDHKKTWCALRNGCMASTAVLVGLFCSCKLFSRCFLFIDQTTPGTVVSLFHLFQVRCFGKKPIKLFSTSLQRPTEELQQSSWGNPHNKRGDSKLLNGKLQVLLNFLKGSAKSSWAGLSLAGEAHTPIVFWQLTLLLSRTGEQINSPGMVYWLYLLH